MPGTARPASALPGPDRLPRISWIPWCMWGWRRLAPWSRSRSSPTLWLAWTFRGRTWSSPWRWRCWWCLSSSPW